MIIERAWHWFRPAGAADLDADMIRAAEMGFSVWDRTDRDRDGSLIRVVWFAGPLTGVLGTFYEITGEES